MAKQLVGFTSLLVGIYFHAIAYSDLRDPAKYPLARLQQLWWVYLLPLLFLALSTIFALCVFFPGSYRVNIQSSEGSQAVFEHIAARKLLFVRLSGIALILAMLGTLTAAAAYLY